MSYFYDTYAIIEILERNKNYFKFSEQIITTGVLNLFEVYYYFLTKHNKITADYWARKLNLNLRIIKHTKFNACKDECIK